MKLWLIRHAKSSWGQPGLSDFERPLNNRGKRDGPRMAAWLSEQSHPAQWIWTSTAARAMATTAFVRRGFELDDTAVAPLDDLYHAAPEALLAAIHQTPTDIDSVALVAHNPGLTYLVNLLGTTPATDNLPTFGIARFDCPSDWQTLAPGTATLELLVGPKTID
jgi:phosphohistidine phosphatase